MIYRREEYIEEARGDERFPVKHIEMLDPVGQQGERKFVGQVSLGVQTPMGVQQMPVHFEIEADDIMEAFEKFAAAAEPRIEEAQKQIREELQKARKEASSRIVRPDEAGMGGAGGAGGVIDFDQLRTDQ